MGQNDAIDVHDFSYVVGPGHIDAGDHGPLATARRFGIPATEITEFRLVHVRGGLDAAAQATLVERLIVDPVGQWCSPAADHDAVDGSATGLVVETGLRPGVTDREGAELVRAAAELGLEVEAATVGRRWVIQGDLDEAQIDELAQRVLHNDVIERWALGSLPAAFADQRATEPATTTIVVRGLDEAGLAEVNKARRLGLDPEEMVVIRDHFTALDRDPTDGELETLAQTWSEHCAHKTFRAAITMPDGSVIDGLLKSYLRSATDEIDAPYVHSAFVDNAGIVAFDDGWDVAIKAETHNHPSALEPFGGSNTGVGGVVRDILGVSAKPIAVTDILCFGPEDLDPAELPDGVLHPARIRDGVIAGVGDYGNKIGVPNIAGAILHDPAYTTTPLVFAGCLGLLPTGSNPTNAQPGDSIVVLGGAVGRDGVGGATFSSQTMGVETADIAGSSVQIGDPIVEKGLIDVICAARDAQLYTAVTDCGAGGLSSAVGEMAETLGADVDLQLVPRKYPGLAPWEVWLSEAQERMVVACADPAPMLELAARWGVGADVIGRFTGEGRLIVRNGDETMIDIDCEFLHDGRPKRQMTAAALDTSRPERQAPASADVTALTLGLLAHPSIRSNEDVVRTYDHEVLGGTLVRPYAGAAGDGAADGTVVIPPGTSGTRGVALGVGVNAVIGGIDPEAMAWSVIDEAVRNAVVAGADPAELSLLDNFAWGNPTDPDTLAGLVAACQACHDAALAFSAPFVSGKDSLYNVFVRPDGTPDPVAPTLVITAMGIVKDLTTVPLTGTVNPGDDVWLVGPAAGALGGSHLDEVLGADHGGEVPRPEPGAVARHHELAAAIAQGLVVSAHDLAEGGLAVAAAEWAFAGRTGVRIDLGDANDDLATLFGEGAGRYLVEVAPGDAEAFAAAVPSAARIGTVIGSGTDTPNDTPSDRADVAVGSVRLSFDDIARAWVGGNA
ncbi:MAG: phosphoribosylformylglycinamidine synthase subunit PurL [Acidimicrobiales bacterium]